MSGLRERLRRLTGNAPCGEPAAGAGPAPSGGQRAATADGEPGSTLQDEGHPAREVAGAGVGSAAVTADAAVPGGASSALRGAAGSTCAEGNASADTRCRAWARLDVALQRNEQGSFLKRTRAYPLQHRHGRSALGELAGAACQLSTLVARAVDSHRGLLFIDTETTGLGVGAGNVPFMIGIGYYTDREFMVEQLLIRHPGEEAAMLRYLQELLSEFTHIVSYNGRTFDWPVLKNRFVMNRMRLAEEPGHIDFLYPSRSLWKHTLPSCRLGKVEEEKLGFMRGEDIPGSLAPALYFQFLTAGDPSMLEGVYRHNELDILSLAGLAIHFARLLEGDVPYAELTAEETYRLAVWLDKAGKRELSHECMERLRETAWHREHEYLPALAAWHKKRKQHDEAARMWHRYIEVTARHRGVGAEPYLELAKYYEHCCKNYGEALRFAEEALERTRRRMSLLRRGWDKGDPDRDIRQRIERLRRKQAAKSDVACYAGTLV